MLCFAKLGFVVAGAKSVTKGEKKVVRVTWKATKQAVSRSVKEMIGWKLQANGTTLRLADGLGLLERTNTSGSNCILSWGYPSLSCAHS